MYVDSCSEINSHYSAAQSNSKLDDVSDLADFESLLGTRRYKPKQGSSKATQQSKFNKNSKSNRNSLHSDLIRIPVTSKSDEKLNFYRESPGNFRPKSLHTDAYGDWRR